MKLLELEPQWIERDGRRIGFMFKSPANPKFWQTCYEVPPPRREQWALHRAILGEEAHHYVQGCNPDARWSISPTIDQAEFATLSVTPSLDGSAGGLWHGYITDGEIR